jgi:hypothetical protein
VLERIAWYTTRPASDGGDYKYIHLYDTLGSRTPLGDVYANFPKNV